MKNLYSILCICIILLLSILIGRHYYLKNVDSMRAQAESAFVQVLKQEIGQKTKILDISFHSSISGLDTVPLVVHITTASGKQKFIVDAAKSKKNISQSYIERTLQSIALMENPLIPDTLNCYWQNALYQYGIDAKTSIKVSITDLNNEVSYCESSKNVMSASCLFTFVSYVGNRCEMEVLGSFIYTPWMAFGYECSPFIYILISTAFLCRLLCYVLVLRSKSNKVVIVEKEVVREKIRVAKETEKVKPELYYLNDELIFDSRNQVLINKGERINLSPQLSILLRFFLDAPDYTVTDDDLVRNIWGTTHGATIQNFRSAAQRLYTIFEKVDFPIKFVRVEIDKYALIFINNQ